MTESGEKKKKHFDGYWKCLACKIGFVETDIQAFTSHMQRIHGGIKGDIVTYRDIWKLRVRIIG